MKIVVLKECRSYEKRVAATPDTVKRFVKLGLEVSIESGAGQRASIPDAAYRKAGATIGEEYAKLLAEADILLKVQRPLYGKDEYRDELSAMNPGSTLIGMLDPLTHPEDISMYAKQGVTAFALELLPRITRAQTMDVLSSQSNLAGFRAVIDAAYEYNRAFPLMMTAAGTIVPARVLVLGAGVAGLQAIATAKRLGAVVSAFDVRPAVKGEVESLGAAFIEVDAGNVESGEAAGGYARIMSDEYKAKQRTVIHEAIKSQDIVICTALIPGKKAPELVTEEMLADMKPGSVIVDIAVGQGGNCFASKEGEIIEWEGIKIIGHANFPSRLAASASSLYARNLFNFLLPLFDPDTKCLVFNEEDEIVSKTMLTRNNVIVHPLYREKGFELAISRSN